MVGDFPFCLGGVIDIICCVLCAEFLFTFVDLIAGLVLIVCFFIGNSIDLAYHYVVHLLLDFLRLIEICG